MMPNSVDRAPNRAERGRQLSIPTLTFRDPSPTESGKLPFFKEDMSPNSNKSLDTPIGNNGTQPKRTEFALNCPMSNCSQPARSRSFRNKPRPKLLELTIERPRRNSMPSPTANVLAVSFNSVYDGRYDDTGSKPLQRVRSFNRTSKGVVNRGDSFKRKSCNSLASTGSRNSGGQKANSRETTPVHTRSRRRSSLESQESGLGASNHSSITPSYYKVVILGACGVGKTAVTTQFMTSEYMGAFDRTSLDEHSEENTIDIVLDGEESTLEFVDPVQNELCIEDMAVDAYVVLYSVTDRGTLQAAVDTLSKLRHELGTDRAIILAANKIDVVRKRKIDTKEGQEIATQFNCKYAEISALLNHHIDELLVGILSQIRFKLTPEKPVPIPVEPVNKKIEKKSKPMMGPRGLLRKLLGKNKKRSCENLYAI